MMRSFFSRSDWAIRLLGLSRLNKPDDKPGLVMVQIDGLSLTQIKQALRNGHLPFLNSLLEKKRYAIHPFYSGMPSNTPAVQGELFYGVKTCVPAFSFVDHKTGQPVKMLDSVYVASVEAELNKQGRGLLIGGSSYSNIFAGGADEAHCCWGNMGWSGVMHAVNPFVFPFLLILYIDIFIRTFLLLIVEVVSAAFECIRGTLKGKSFIKELDLIWLRALICVSLREFVTAGASMDVMRGLPIIHLNLLGYDEQSHFRGPSSAFAHWSLQGIDDAIRRIDRAIKGSPYRHYDLWVYSDHGQDRTVPYVVQYGCTLEEAVKKIFIEPEAIVTAMGPMGHIYPRRKLERSELDLSAKRLIDEAKIPLVIIRLGNNKVLAWTKRGSFILPDESGEVFGKDHSFLAEVTEDIIRACYHPDAGEFIILGWCQGEMAISFAYEYGAHAGAGHEETKGFALLPLDVPIETNGRNYLRPIILRKTVQDFLSQGSTISFLNSISQSTSPKSLRIMSYNVHGCKGMDNRISTDRIVRVIAHYNPDVIALQELDVNRKRSFSVDQAERIARKLEMSFQFHPAFCHKGEQFGNAILSRYPMGLIKKDALPRLRERSFFESRGAVWVRVDCLGTKINIINTHLSLWPKEQLLQIKTLLSSDWMQQAEVSGPIILCGDLNTSPNSLVYKEICKRFKDSQLMLSGHRPSKTWFAGFPIRRIDHIFVTSEFSVNSIQASHRGLDRLASDHLPIILDLSLESQEV